MKNKELKKRFEEWYIKAYNRYPKTLRPTMEGTVLRVFYRKTKAEQWGVMQDFYDSEGIWIGISNEESLWNLWDWSWDIRYSENKNASHICQTRTQARVEALIKAEEIWEEQND